MLDFTQKLPKIYIFLRIFLQNDYKLEPKIEIYLQIRYEFVVGKKGLRLHFPCMDIISYSHLSSFFFFLFFQNILYTELKYKINKINENWIKTFGVHNPDKHTNTFYKYYYWHFFSSSTSSSSLFYFFLSSLQATL